MEDDWVRSDCVTVEGFPQLFWETLQRLGYTEPPTYYGREYQEDGMPKCEVHLHVPQHPSCPGIKSRCIPAVGKELEDTCQVAARQALMDYCQIFEEDIEHTPARFFPVPDQTTPTWCGKIQDLENVGRQMPDAIMPFTVKYLHALDSLYEDQRQELIRWITRAKEAEAEVRALKLELEETNKRIATTTDKMKYYRRELRETLKRPHYKTQSRRMTKGRRTFAIPADRRIEIPGVPRITQEVMRAIDAKGKAPVIPEYDPEHPEFDPDEYIRRESHSDHARSIETEESVADNLNNIKAAEDATNAGPSQVLPGQDDGYASYLYALRDNQPAQDMGKAVNRDLHEIQFL
jgi:hypothetical protein